MIYAKNFKRAILNVGMFFAIIMVFIILFRTFITYDLFNIGKEMDVISLLTYPFAMSTFVPFACIFPVLPYAFTYLEEKNSGYYKYILMRCGVKKYIFNKIFFTGLSGGISLLIPFTFIFIIAGVCSQQVSTEFFPYMYIGKIWEPYLYIFGGKLVLFLRLILIFLFGVLWAEIALLISTIISNRYIVFVVPFVIYQISWMILPGIINPVILFRADFDQREYINIVSPFFVQCIFIVAIIFILKSVLKKKVRYE